MTYDEYLKSAVWHWQCWHKLFQDGELSEHDRLIVAHKLLHGKGFPAYYGRLVDVWNEQTRQGRLCKATCVKCERRFQRRHLDIHHLTYIRLFHETLDDLAILCRGCHAVGHGKRPPFWHKGLSSGVIDEEELDCMGSGVERVGIIALRMMDDLAAGPDRRMT
jgi:hypothetical protein